MAKHSPKRPTTRSEIESLRSQLILRHRNEPDPAVRVVLITEIEACNQRLERDFGVPHPSGVPTTFHCQA